LKLAVGVSRGPLANTILSGVAQESVPICPSVS